MKKFLMLFLIATAVPLVFSTCKKGEQDPFISLRSRKARITGKWTLKSGTEEQKTESETTIITYEGSRAKRIYNSPLTGHVSEYDYSETWEFRKDGSFSATIVADKSTTSMQGQWNFTSGIGKETKNKEQIILNVTSQTTGSSTNSSTGPNVNNIFDIEQLKNKEIILKRANTYTGKGGTAESKVEKKYVQ